MTDSTNETLLTVRTAFARLARENPGLTDNTELEADARRLQGQLAGRQAGTVRQLDRLDTRDEPPSPLCPT